MNARTALLLGMAGLGLAVCGRGGGDRWAGTVTDSAGIAIVSNPVEGMWADGERWTVEEELRIGALEEPDYQFGQVGWIEVDSRGRIFVLDMQGQHVKVFSPEGVYERTLGGPGAGPGELGRGAAFLAMAAGDTLLVPDIVNQRINRYAPDGASLGSFPLSLREGLPLGFRATSAGVIAEQIRPLALPGLAAADSMDVIVILAADGTVTDTLTRFASGKTFGIRGASPEINLYSAEPVWTLTDRMELVFAVNDDYRIRVHSPAGEPVRMITKPFERRPVTEQDRETVMGALEKAWRDAGVPPAALAQLRGMVRFGEFFPAFQNLQVGPQGTIWVQHVRPASELGAEAGETYDLTEDAGGADWDVFDAEGRYLGIVTMPQRFAPRTFRGDRIYGVWRDELDVPYVVRLRVVGGEIAGN